MSKPSLKFDPLSTTARDVLGLFSDALAEVRFPDVDLHSLQAAADELRALQLEVERLEAELETARALVSAQSEALTGQAERGLAYARIYAAADAKLSLRVAEVGQSTSPVSPPAAPKKRGRARKGEGDANLFNSVDDNSSQAAPESVRSYEDAAEHAA